MTRKILFPIMIGLLSFLFWLIVLELVSGFIIAKWGDPLDWVKPVLEVDRFLGWRQKPDFNGRFLNVPLKTNALGLRSGPLPEKRAKSRFVLVLGPSSTFGWGVGVDQTYSFQLQQLLQKKYPGYDIVVVNAGQIGYSSWQGLEFYKKYFLGKTKFDLVVVAYGVNDVDRYRFFYSDQLPDRQEFADPKPGWQVTLENFFLRFNSVNLVTRSAYRLVDAVSCSQRRIPVRRVSDADFAANIDQLIGLASGQGASVLLMTSSYHLPVYSPVDYKSAKSFDLNYKLGLSSFDKGNYAAAIDYFRLAAASDPKSDDVHYYLSVAYCRQGRTGQSQEAIKTARLLEGGRIAKDIDRVDQVLYNLSLKDRAVLLDTRTVVAKAGVSRSFLDPVHFTVSGNQAVARGLYDKIVEEDLLKINR